MDFSDVATVCGHQCVERLVGEVRSVVNEVRHHVTPGVTTTGVFAVRRPDGSGNPVALAVLLKLQR